MHLRRLATLIIALCVSPIWAKSSLDSGSAQIRASTNKAAAASGGSKASHDVEDVLALTSLVVKSLDQIASPGQQKASKYIAPFISRFEDLTEGISAINDDNSGTTPKRLTSADRYELCTTVWNLIYKERNLMSFIGSLGPTFITNGANKDLIQAMLANRRAVDLFFHELIPRLGVCREQLENALEDFDTTSSNTRESLYNNNKKKDE